MYSIIFGDWKVGIFYVLFSGLLFIRNGKLRFAAMAFGLLLPVLFSASYQHQLKNYPHFIQTFRSVALETSDTSPLFTHDFIYFSREVLLQEPQTQTNIVSMAQMENLIQNPPASLILFVYRYYDHAYPAEQEYLNVAREWIKENYVLTDTENDQWIRIEKYSRQQPAD